jgi:hypothetical protein
MRRAIIWTLLLGLAGLGFGTVCCAQTVDGPATHLLELAPTAGADAELEARPVRIAGRQGLRINELQLLGTHNSYHVAPDAFAAQMIAAVAAEEARAIDCTQRPLTEQLELCGIRHFELDCYLDPEGGLFADPLVMRLARAAGHDVPAFDPDGVLKTPGIKVLHSPDFDVRTTALTLQAALAEIKGWSDRNPAHVPLFVLLELKSDSFSPTRPLPWGADGFKELHQTLEKVWPRSRILTPRDVQAEAATLRDAVAGKGWPAVDDHRGKLVLLLDNEGSVRDRYLDATGDDRLLFVSVDRNHPAAAWMKRNDPESQTEEIRSLVNEGFLVRTRADSGTRESRANDGRRRDLAIATGAQLVSTDFPEPDRRFSSYCVQLPLPLELPPARVHHVVVCWLKEPGNADARRRIVEASRAFGGLPGVVAVSAGEPIESDRPIVDDSFDVAITMTFASQAALDAYLVHPEHRRATAGVLGPLVEKIVVYDFRE